MPDILIRGMEMPHNCFQCPLSVLKGERLFCEVTKEEVLRSKLAPDCPLHELPPHGDLIDRDAVIEDLQKDDTYQNWAFRQMLWKQPVVVPAERREG